jgi:hypothetical protein
VSSTLKQVHIKKAAPNTSIFQTVGKGMLNIGAKLGGKTLAARIKRLRTQADAGDESAKNKLMLLGLSSMLVGTGLGTAAGSALNYPTLGGAIGATLGTAPAIAAGSDEKPTPTVIPGFGGETKLGGATDMSAPSDEVKKQAFKYGFFMKVAELGLTPGEFTKRALSGTMLAAGAVGKAGEGTADLGKWTVDKLLATLKLGVTLPLIAAPVAGALAGGTYRMLTAPKYESPKDLQNIETVAMYKRLAREALRRAKRKQQARLELTGAKEPEVVVPELAMES